MMKNKNHIVKHIIAVSTVSLCGMLVSASAFSQNHPIVQMVKRNASSYAIDGNNGGVNGQDTYLWSENENNINQQWYEVDRGNGYYSYQKVATNYCLDGNHGGDNAQNVYLWTCNDGNQNQHWRKVDVGDGHYRLEKRNASGYSIDGNKGGADGQSIYLWASSDSNQNQHWKFNYLNGTAKSQLSNSSWSLSSATNSNGLSYMIDGDISSRWSTGVKQAAGQAFVINFNERVSFDRIVLSNAKNQNDYPRSYRVSVSDEGTNWVQVASGSGSFGLSIIDFSDQLASYVKLEQTGSDSYYWWSVDELEVWANAAGSEYEGGTPVIGTSPYRGNTTYVGGGGHVAGALQTSCDTPSGYSVVSSLAQMRSAMAQSNVKVALAPGLYEMDSEDTNLFTSQILPGGKDAEVLFPVTGSNSVYDFRCAKIEFHTDLWEVFWRDEVVQLRTIGNNNKIYNLTIEDIGTTDPQGGALNILMDGRDNLLEGAVITARGSEPYGLGDAYGKGGGPVLWHRKHSVALIRGLRNTVKQSTFYNYAYGHSVFMQASDDTVIDGVYVQGELRSTADMLASNNPRFADADARAASVNYITEWGYRLPTGYWMSLQEDGIRAYNGGITVVDGVESTGAAHNVTVLNSVVRHNRSGVVLVHASGTKYVENTTVIGNESGFGIGSGDIVDCYADASVGPVLSFAYSSDSGTTADITVLPTDGSKNGSGALAYIGGRNHHVTLRATSSAIDPNLEIRVSGDKKNIRMLNGNLDYQNNLTTTNSVVNNYTNYPLVLDDDASGVSGQSDGPVSGNTGNNSIR